MSYASKKPFPERFTSEGVKSSIFMGMQKWQALFLSQKAGTFHPGGERFGERFFNINKGITTTYINLSPFTPPPRTDFCARTREERKVYFQKGTQP
ncbi:MAG TPA: hypothetical protein PLP49_11795 [Anaerohalosphaeraceae bacterium]|jgi:hypothetical protein|nr:hypothetical protein [Anaerohalosphaeraceae bacterium]